MEESSSNSNSNSSLGCCLYANNLHSGEDKIVLYFTILRGIHKTCEDCCSVRMILKGFRVAVDEKDISIDSSYRKELQNALGEHVGNAEEIKPLNESGELENLLKDFPVKDSWLVCESCGDARFVPSSNCNGPIHHENANLKLGENYKLIWAAKYIENAKLNPHNLHKKIADNIVELKGHFAGDVLALTGTKESLKGFTSLEEKLSWMLFVDGCSLLHILEHADLARPELMNIKVYQLVLVMMDVLFLENQLAYLVLKLLWKNDIEAELKYTMKEFLKCHHWATPENKRSWSSRIQDHFEVQNNKKDEEQHRISIQNELPTHLLDLQRNIILTKSSSKVKKLDYKNQGRKISEQMMTYRNIQDLRAVGIKFKSSGTRRPNDIGFSDGWFTAKLILPEIVVDDTT
ncbi:hypothetical protein P8452_07435 [Trifolium repens]|nr:hypothetical protein P8452_07435 [Trifolium repens]